jgi:hypothetical protein
VFENRVARRIFGPERDEELGGWSMFKLMMRWARHVAQNEGVHTGKPKGK